MSPATKTRKTSKALTIEFSGISTLVWNPKKGTAEVRLVDLASAGFQQHYAALGLAVGEDTPDALKGPDAEAAVSLPSVNVDMGVWNLMGTEVDIIGASGKLMVDDAKVDVTKKPAKTAESVRWLADIGFLSESSSLDPLCPIAAIIRIPAGRITVTAIAGSRKVDFLEEGTPIGPTRFCSPRFKAVIPFDKVLAIRLDRRRVLRFADSMSVIVSNTCVCGLGVRGKPNHFYAHYDVTKAKRRPTVKRAGKQLKFPSWPEFCWPAMVEE